MYLSCMPKSRSTTGGNKKTYYQRGLDYGHRTRDLLEPIQGKGQDKG
jgi:hypothetical protein